MSFAYLEPTEPEADIETELGLEMDAATEDAATSEAPKVVENYSSPEAQKLRVTLVQDQLLVAAKKVNLLHGLGLERTSGYAEAMAIYEAKLADFNQLKARYGL